jgi:hypothetical protein
MDDQRTNREGGGGVGAMPEVNQWILASLAFCVAANSFMAAFLFPDRDMRWHNKSQPRNRRIPMSIRGRIAFGSCFAYLGSGMLFGHLATRTTESIWIVGLLTLLIMVGVVYSRDKRNYEEFGKT